MQKFSLKFLTLFCVSQVLAQSPGDTILVETFNYSQTYGINQWSPGIRDTVIDFPTDQNISYEKILMTYNIRCKNGNVSPPQSGQTDIGCGEWDASCNTYITDSTRVDSLKSFISSHQIAGFNGTTFNYYSSPVFDHYRYIEQGVELDSIISETNSIIGSGNLALSHPLNISDYNGKSQYLYTATELVSAGLTAGDIDAISLNVLNGLDTANFFRLRIKETTDTLLSTENVHLNGFTEVYFHSTEFSTGNQRIQFHTPFNWDGTSNLILELSFNNESGSGNLEIEGEDSEENYGLYSSGDRTNFFNGSNYIESNNYKGISGNTNRTIEAWIKTEGTNSEIVSWGVNNSSQKWVFNINNDGVILVEIWGGDVIGTTPVNDGEWHHVSCVLNGSNISQTTLYIDGVQESLSTIGSWPVNTNTVSGINMRTSRGVNNRYFDGNIDEVRVWSEALTEQEIKDWMYKSLDAGHPKYNNLESYYQLNEGTGNAITDSSPHARHATVQYGALWEKIQGVNLFKEFQSTTERPNITFLQGNYNLSITQDTVYDAVLQSPTYVVEREIIPQYGTMNNDSIHIVSENYYWQPGYSYYFDENGTAYDSTQINTDGTIIPTELTYYKRYPSKFEIMSFVTPYGINLDLGPNGKTWVFDMTDYAPLLKGSKRMTVERGGQWMEDMDIRFLYIVGTPPREVIDIQQLWKPDAGYMSYSNISADRVFEPRDVIMTPSASSYKLRSTITGHGQDGEFVQREHYLNIDGGSEEFSWIVWKDCDENPVYPQGGTWIYDRAGWCPGMPSDLAEFDITNFVTPGQASTIDYGISFASGASNYIVNNQLVSYGDINFNLDAAIMDISAPTNRVEYARTNSICADPKVIIKNTGATQLTSLTIEYWVNNASNKETYNWTGNLDFMESQEVTLPANTVWDAVTESGNVFHAEVKNPNGGSDEYSFNNVYNSEFNIPDVVPANFYIQFRTNSAASESKYELFDEYGNSIFVRSGMANKTTYKDTFDLGVGCYTFVVTDTDDDGINFWANNDGNGSVRIRKVGGTTVKTLNPDFGGSIVYSFTIDYPLKYEEINGIPAFEIYPNPTNDKFSIKGKDLDKSTISIYNSIGQVMQLKPEFISNGEAQWNVSDLRSGIYMINVLTDGKLFTEKLIIQ